ncbi:hypothetical protein KNV05_gp087 [Vibrio phage River4]|uniref:Uncharacterized protein n=1 Tax=Vibrio phage River4 TaxID=2736288 RepID=A0A6M9Z3Z1_9CAUD|nr:hypothetical protein KNV05_gp087 [Vibrio phage River4]QKN84749.1 hypothetical protein RIVER4_87 [Vibrio phage River4]
MPKATGYEKAFIKEWGEWDGDQNCLTFLDCKLDGIFAIIAGTEKADVVEINNEDCKVRLYNYGDDAPFFVQPFKITLVENTDGESDD